MSRSRRAAVARLASAKCRLAASREAYEAIEGLLDGTLASIDTMRDELRHNPNRPDLGLQEDPAGSQGRRSNLDPDSPSLVRMAQRSSQRLLDAKHVALDLPVQLLQLLDVQTQLLEQIRCLISVHCLTPSFDGTSERSGGVA